MEAKNQKQHYAIAEERRKELESYQHAIAKQWGNNEMEDSRRGLCLALLEREAEMEKDFQERTDHAAIVNARAEEQQQILHHEYKRLHDKVEASQANRVVLNALYNDAEVTEGEDRARMEKNLQYTEELQQQSVNRQRQEQRQYEDRLIEKKMQEDVIRTLMLANEDRSVAERERKIHERENQSQILGEKLLAETVARQKREDTINMQQERECREKNAQEDVTKQLKMEQWRTETEEFLSARVKRCERDAKQLAKEDAEFRRESEEQMALEDEEDLERERKKKEKDHQYMLDLKEQIEDNARRRKAESELEQERDRQQVDYDTFWPVEVTEERSTYRRSSGTHRRE